MNLTRFPVPDKRASGIHVRRIFSGRRIAVSAATMALVVASSTFAADGAFASGGVSGSASFGVYEIRHASTSNKVIDIPNSASTPGVQMHLWDDHDGPNQRWEPKIDMVASYRKWLRLRDPSGVGREKISGYKLVNPANGLCLDGMGGSTAPGTRVIQYTCGPDGTLNQAWFPIKANGAEFLVSGSSFANIDADLWFLHIVNNDIRVESKDLTSPYYWDHGQAVAIAAPGSSNGTLLTLHPASTYNLPQRWVTTVVSGTSTVDPGGGTCLSCVID